MTRAGGRFGPAAFAAGRPVFQMRLMCAALTDPGRRRRNNEDSFCVREELGLFLVADGMGGHVGGEIASRLVAAEIEQVIAAGAQDDGVASPDGRLQAAFAEANRKLAARIAADDALRGMATTAVALLADGASCAIAHVGDSRAYRHRSGRLFRLTNDHSWVEEQIRAGMLTPEAGRQHPWRHIVTRAFTGGAHVGTETAALSFEAGDRVLLCSDGLTTVVSDDGIADMLREDRSPADVCRALVDQANRGGGPDNVTVVLVDVHAG